jgi:hypothetical protein
LGDLVRTAEAADATLALARMRRDLDSRLLAAGCTGTVALGAGSAWLDGPFTARHLRIIADALGQVSQVVQR